MQPSLRIARVDVSGYRLLSDDFAGLEGLHRELQAVIRRHLPAVTASVLALPVPGTDGRTVDWYSDLAGQPVALPTLPAAQRAAARARLEDRLASLRQLANQLPGRERGSESLAQALRSATLYPDDHHVYVIGDEPVITLWGFVLVKDRRRRGALVVPARAGDGRRPAWPWPLAVTLLLALGAGGWYWYLRQQEASLESELDRAIATECAGPDRLTALLARLNRLDPESGRYAELRRRIAEAQGRCTVAAEIERELEGAGWDCARLAALHRGPGGPDLTRPPLARSGARLAERLRLCNRAADVGDRLKQRSGECVALAELDRELGTPPADAVPMQQVRDALDRELTLCKTADELAAGITANHGNCEGLHALDRQLGAVDSARPPLAPLRARLDTALADCVKAAGWRQALLDAQMDCVKLRALDQRMPAGEATGALLQPIRRGLDEALGKCKVSEKE